MTIMVDEHRSGFFNRRQFLQITAVAGTVMLGGRLLQQRTPRVQKITETRLLMGTLINLTVLVPDVAAEIAQGQTAVAAAFAEMERLIALFDRRQANSPLAILNQTGELRNPPPDVIQLLKEAQVYSEATAGAFDITIQPLVTAAAAGESVAAALPLVNYSQLQIDAAKITLPQPGMKITVDGIAKGRVVDGAITALQQSGFANILVEAGGDLVGQGKRPDGSPWRVGIDHPRQAGSLLAALTIAEQAVATSGDYRHSFTEDHRQHHILDPRTGDSPTELASVTVVAPTAMAADALSTAVMVMGSTAGLTLVNRLPHVEALLVTKEMKIMRSPGFPAAL